MSCVCIYWKTTMKTLSIAVVVVFALFITSVDAAGEEEASNGSKDMFRGGAGCIAMHGCCLQAECLKEHGKPGIVQYIRDICSKGKCACFYNCGNATSLILPQFANLDMDWYTGENEIHSRSIRVPVRSGLNLIHGAIQSDTDLQSPVWMKLEQRTCFVVVVVRF
ncbi:unnamed protein product [Camellia sinensis]